MKSMKCIAWDDFHYYITLCFKDLIGWYIFCSERRPILPSPHSCLHNFFVTFTPSSFFQTLLIFLPPSFLLFLNSFKLRRKIVVPIFSPSSYTIFMLSVFPHPFFLFPTCLKTKNRWHRLLPLPTPFIITHNFQLIPPPPLSFPLFNNRRLNWKSPPTMSGQCTNL